MNETPISDLALAAYLLAKGHRLLRVDGPQRRRVFMFDASESAVVDYFAGESEPGF